MKASFYCIICIKMETRGTNMTPITSIIKYDEKGADERLFCFCIKPTTLRCGTDT